ncbi:MAG: fibronectin type III domain-containing protein [Patescibacteria group bacterium]|nr:fibronectin type III domain-containing protein [Patescibacteria group bacterium]
MSLKSRTILSIFISLSLIGLAILIWSYRTGRITIFGSEVIQTYTATVNGSKLSGGNPDSNLVVTVEKNSVVTDTNSVYKIKLGTEKKDATAYLKANLSDNEKIDEQFIGIRTNNSELDNATASNVENEVKNRFSALLRSITKDSSNNIKIRDYNLNAFDLSKTNPEIVFKTDENNKKEVGKLFWDLNGTKEKYLGLNLFDSSNVVSSHPASGSSVCNPGQNENNQSVCSIGSIYQAVKTGISSNNQINHYSPISLGSRAHWGGCSDGLPLPCEWDGLWPMAFFSASADSETKNPASDIRTKGQAVIARSKDDTNLGKPTLIWKDLSNTGDYIGMGTIKGMYSGSTGTEGALFLTSTGVVGGVTGDLLHDFNRDYTAENFPDKNAKVVAKEIDTYFDSGTYTYSAGAENVTKFVKFIPSDQTIPAGTKIEYKFSGSTNGTDWSSPSDSVEGTDAIKISGIDLQGKIPDNSKYLKIEMTFKNITDQEHIWDTPTIGEFQIQYQANANGQTPTPGDDTTPPTTPQNLDIRSTMLCPADYFIKWDSATDNVAIGGYEILDGPNTSSTVIATLDANARSYRIGNIPEGQSKDYYVRAFDTASPKNYSSAVKITQIGEKECQPGEIPEVPSEPRELTAKTIDCRSIELSWKAPSSGTPNSYLIYNATTNQMITSISGGKTSTTLANLSGSIKYSYYLKAMGGNNNLSGKSNTVEATTPQCSPVQLNPEPDQIYSLASSNTDNQLSSIGKLVSTGGALWFNILIALLFGGVVSWLILRKK